MSALFIIEIGNLGGAEVGRHEILCVGIGASVNLNYIKMHNLLQSPDDKTLNHIP